MDLKCGLCETKLKKNEGHTVQNLVIDKKPGIIKFTDVLIDLFGSEIDLSKICNDCWLSISNQFIFKQNLRKNLKIPKSNSEVIKQVQKFLSSNDRIDIVTHNNMLIIFPDSKKEFIESFKQFSPVVTLDRSAATQSLPLKKIIVQKVENNSKHSSQFANSYRILPDNEDEESLDDDDKDINYGAKRKRSKKNSPKKSKKQKLSTPKLVKQEISENEPIIDVKCKLNNNSNRMLLDSSGLRLVKVLTQEQKEWLKNMLQVTNRDGNNFECSICCKMLKSPLAINYHYINRHYWKRLSKRKIWVSDKIQDGKKIIVGADGKNSLQYGCTECGKKDFQSQPSLRYHLEQHLKTDFDDDENVSDDDDQDSSV